MMTRLLLTLVFVLTSFIPQAWGILISFDTEPTGMGPRLKVTIKADAAAVNRPTFFLSEFQITSLMASTTGFTSTGVNFSQTFTPAFINNFGLLIFDDTFVSFFLVATALRIDADGTELFVRKWFIPTVTVDYTPAPHTIGAPVPDPARSSY